MKKEQNNTPENNEENSTKYGGALPFVMIFGGITVALILIKLLMNLLS